MPRPRFFSRLVESLDRQTHNDLDVAIIQDRSSWTCYVGDGVPKLPSV